MKLRGVLVAGVVGVLATVVAPSAQAASQSSPPYDSSFTSGNCQSLVLLGPRCYVDSNSGAFAVSGRAAVGVREAIPVDGPVATVGAMVDLTGVGATTCINGSTTVRITLSVWVRDLATGQIVAAGQDIVDARIAGQDSSAGRFAPIVELSDQGELVNGLVETIVTVENRLVVEANLLCRFPTGAVVSAGRFTSISVD